MAKKYSMRILLIFLLLLPSIVIAQGTANFFPKFRGDLDAVLTEHGIDPQHQNIHIMFLLNSVKTDGPEAEGMEKIVHQMLTNYLVPGDIVSLAAYELHLRDDACTWEQPFQPKNVSQLEYCLPTAPQIRSDGTSKGHDQEAAIVEALGRLTGRNNLPIVVVMSPTRDSQHPDIPVNYRLFYEIKDIPSVLKQSGYLDTPIPQNAHVSVLSSKLHQPVDVAIFYRFYVPTALTASGQLTDHTRQVLLDVQHQTNLRQHILQLLLLPVGILLLLGIVYVIYRWWIKRFPPPPPSRLLKIGSEQRIYHPGHLLYVGGPNCGSEDENVALQNIMAGVRVAEITTEEDQLIIRGFGQYVPMGTLTAHGIPIGPDEQHIAFIRSDGQQTYEFTIRSVE